eukprot:14625075-Alexandrium_andersonii.AAC.1
MTLWPRRIAARAEPVNRGSGMRPLASCHGRGHVGTATQRRHEAATQVVLLDHSRPCLGGCF